MMMTTAAASTECSARISRADIYLYQGDDYSAEVQVYKPDDTEADLTGYTAIAQIRYGSADEFSEVILEPSIAIDEAAGKLSIRINHDDTATLPVERLAWDLQLTAPDGIVTTILVGDVIVQAEVTRPVGAQSTRAVA